MTTKTIDFERVVADVHYWYEEASANLENEYLDGIQVIPANKDGRIDGLEDWVEIDKVTDKFIAKAFKVALEKGATEIEFYTKVYNQSDEQPTGEEYLVNFNMEGEEI